MAAVNIVKGSGSAWPSRVSTVNITVKDYSGKVLADIDKNLQRIIKESLDVLEKNIKVETPVDTGRLQASITTDANRVYTDSTEYASYVEYGTSKQSPAAYMRRGLQISIEEINNIVKSL